MMNKHHFGGNLRIVNGEKTASRFHEEMYKTPNNSAAEMQITLTAHLKDFWGYEKLIKVYLTTPGNHKDSIKRCANMNEKGQFFKSHLFRIRKEQYFCN